jgi:hypothetical protein
VTTGGGAMIVVARVRRDGAFRVFTAAGDRFDHGLGFGQILQPPPRCRFSVGVG